MLTPREIVLALGGIAEVAQHCGRDRKVVWAWTCNGIPAKHWRDVERLARRKRVAGITHTALAAAHEYGSEARRRRERERQSRPATAATRPAFRRIRSQSGEGITGTP